MLSRVVGVRFLFSKSNSFVSYDCEAWVLMNPFPVPLSAPIAQFIAGLILVVMSYFLLSYLLLWWRCRAFVPVRGVLMQRSKGAGRGQCFYVYEVGRKSYLCSCSSNLLTLSGAGLLWGEKASNMRPARTAVVYYDPRVPRLSCLDREGNPAALFILTILWGFFLFVVVV